MEMEMEMEMETESRDEHKFLQLRDAIASLNQKVCLIGVVFEFSLPKKSRGSDHFCTVKVIDESYTKPGISVNFFAPVVERLPRIASPGDIIVLSDVVMKTHNAGVYAYFNKKFSSFGLYEGNHGQDFVPYQCSPTFCPRHEDSAFISTLRKWLLHFQFNEESSSFLFLREVKEGECGDIICKILHVCETSENEWMAFVWDGTDTPPASLNAKVEEELNNQLPLQLEPSPLLKDQLCSFPTVGTVLRVVIGRGSEKNILHLLSTGKWMKFVNILFEVHAGLWRGVVTSFTKLQYLPNEDNLMLARQRSYDERLSLTLGRIPYSSFPWCSEITEVDHGHVPFVTLMDVLTYSKVTAIFKCVVRVVAAFPWRPEEFCSQSGTYRVRLTIEDPTARIHAFLFAEDGEKFFNGYPPIDVLTRKRNKLLGIVVDNEGNEVENTARNPPWVQCCLKSYYLDKNDAWGSRHYRIFGTAHLG